MPMSARLLRPRSTGFHPEAQDWRNRVIANGGTVSGSTLTAVSNFCRSIDAAGIRDRFYRLNLLCGDNLSAALVPLYRGTAITGTQLGNATDTNNNFVSGDYAETGTSGGLKGNASNKFLTTGLTFASAPVATISMSAYAAQMETIATSNSAFTILGSLNASGGFHGAALSAAWNFSANDRRCDFIGGSGQAVPKITSGILAAAHLAASNTSSGEFKLFQNGVAVATETATVGTASNNQNGPILVFARQNANTAAANPVQYSASRIRAYHVGASMTDAQNLAFYNAMQTFQTALSRNV